ncbi:MAG: hypothetical protein ACFE95_22195 [Candidatus Hodarchaeota archaeon]
MRTRTKLTSILLVALLSLFLLPTARVSGAAATAASLELSSDSYLEGTPVTIRVYDITASGSSFGIYFSYDASGTDTIETKSSYANISVQLGTGDDEWVRTMIFDPPTSGSYIRVHVVDKHTTGQSELASAQIDATDVEELLPTDFIITLGVGLMIIGIIVAIVVSLYRRRR